MVKKCVKDHFLVFPIKEIELKDSLSYEGLLITILDCQILRIRSKEIALDKILWRNEKVEEATWELDGDMYARYPLFFEYIDVSMEGSNVFLHILSLVNS